MQTNPVIELNEVHFGWNDRQTIIDVPALQIPANTRMFLYGPSGCGKSTLLGLLGGVYQARRGAVTLLGQNLSAMKGSQRDRFRADHIGFVFQMFNLVPYLTITENVMLPCRFSRRRRDRIAQRGSTPEQEANRLLDHLGLPQKLRRNAANELSIGQQQRVAVARALIGSPDIIIADEPTSALDTDNRVAFLKLLFEECDREGSTLVFVSHDQSLKSMFDSALAFDQINRASTTA